MSKSRPQVSDVQMLQQVVERLDMLINTVAVQGKSKDEQIRYLAGLGYSNSQMAILMATPKGTIDSIRAGLGKAGVSK
jgi:hypothetical protein